MTIEADGLRGHLCDEGTQDNDMDDVCSASCTANTCDNGTCDDSSGTATCTCDEGWAGENCGVCALGYRSAIVVFSTPAVCELNKPSTTNMRMWLDAAHAASFSIFVVARANAADAGEQFFMYGTGETNITRNMRLLARTNASRLRYRHNTPGGLDEVNLTPADTSAIGALDGDIAEVIVFVPAVAANSRQAVRDYLNAKWKL